MMAALLYQSNKKKFQFFKAMASACQAINVNATQAGKIQTVQNRHVNKSIIAQAEENVLAIIYANAIQITLILTVVNQIVNK